MYKKDLTEDLSLRLSSNDMNFLRDLSAKMSLSVSGCIRSMIRDYRKCLESLEFLEWLEVKRKDLDENRKEQL